MSTIRPTAVMDITSKGEYPSGNLSNFAPHAFVFDGVACASMEGLLQSLKFEDESVQQHICTLAGKAAKKAGSEKNWKRDHTLWWKGRPINRLSRQYQEFLDDAFAALSSNDSFKRALLATGEATLTHSIGEPEPQDTVLTEREFCSRLTAIRARLVIKKMNDRNVYEDYKSARDRLLAAQRAYEDEWDLPMHRTEAGYPNCATCDGGGCYDCTDPA